VAKIAETTYLWRQGYEDIDITGEYSDVAGFCRSVKLEEIREHGYVLTPGRYVGAELWKMTTRRSQIRWSG
jgi:type I restriction enzyme M protein